MDNPFSRRARRAYPRLRASLPLLLLMLLLTRWTAYGGEPDAARTALLHALWTEAELAGGPEDRHGGPRSAPDDSPPARTEVRVAAESLPENLRGAIRSVRLARETPLAALTFDLCELATKISGYDADVVNCLRSRGVRATFFAGGKWMRSHPEKALQLMADPLFELGNHAWTHGNLGVLRGQAVKDQLQWTQAQYELLREELAQRAAAVGLSQAMDSIPPRLRLFRFPYGRCCAESLDCAASLGLASIQWDVQAEDDALSPRIAARNAAARVQPGSILLLHANGVPKNTAAMLPILLDELQARGFGFVTVGELLSLGEPVRVEDCYNRTPGDTHVYDALYGDGTRGRRH